MVFFKAIERESKAEHFAWQGGATEDTFEGVEAKLTFSQIAPLSGEVLLLGLFCEGIDDGQ